MVEFGFYALLLGFCLAAYGLVMGTFSLFKPTAGVILSSRNALISVSFCCTIGASTLWYALLNHDFSVQYAFRNSSVDMPPLFLFTALWSALEGSHLLWTLILSIVSAVALASVRTKNLALLPGLCMSFGIVLTFMLLLNVWASAPLTRAFPIGQFGGGMNALLQNPYMAAHPPCLFLGYSLLVVPFAYSMAAMLRGSFTPDWLISVRRWAMLAWTFLTVGIFLGGKWAYVELGWAGYWAWDPVENSSFMPWLAITAALHTLLILDKTHRLPRLAIILNMLAFTLTFLGTFITRSGIISSVHSFAESDIGPAYLIFILLLLSLSLGLLFTRGLLLQGAGKTNTWTLSKESTLLFTDFFLLFLLSLVCIGTLLPLVVEAVRGTKISIQQPFFNAFAPWVGVGLVSILALGNLMRWKNGKIDDPISSLGFPALWAVILTALIWYRKELDVRSGVGCFLVLWSAGSLAMDLVFKLKNIRWNGRAFLKFNRPYLGAWIVHMGFLIAIAGFLGAYRGIEQQTTLDLGQSTEFYGYTITNQGLNYSQAYNYQYVKAVVKAESAESGHSTVIQPMRSKYTNKEEWLNEIGIFSTFWHDVYLVLASFDMNTKQISLKMHINPTVKLVWTSLIVMVIGALVGLTHRIRRRSLDIDASTGLAIETMTGSMEDLLGDVLVSQPNARHESVFVSMEMGSETAGQTTIMWWHRIRAIPAVLRSRPEGFGTAIFVLLFALAISLFGFSGLAIAQNEGVPAASAISSEPISEGAEFGKSSANAPLKEINPALRAIGEELRCPTCQGISILESETPQSVAMKIEIEKQLSSGKTKEQILKFFQERYGEWILRKPDASSGFGFWIWSIPVGGLLIGPMLLILALRRSRSSMQRTRADLAAEIEQFVVRQKELQLKEDRGSL